jgi:glycosyl transferase family 2
MNGPIDIVMLTYNRLDHLVATVAALEAQTREPYRLTIVDNASGADVRSWLAANRHRFHQIIPRATNEHLPAFQHGIDATTSNPFILCEPDLIVPELEGKCWLGRMLALMDEHPDFGIIGMGLQPVNRPSVLGPEVIDPATRVGKHIVEGNLGMWFQTIRREALVVRYELDAQACEAVRVAGYRVGWTDTLRSYHLGWDDYKLHPGHLASKNPRTHKAYSHYREIELIERPPTLTELANAGPVLGLTRAAEIPDASVLELAWSAPAVAAAAKGAVGVETPDPGPLPLAEGSAGAVVLMDPPAAAAGPALAEAFRVAAHTVVALAPLAAFAGRLPADLAPAGWSGDEAAGPADVPLALAAAADADPALADKLGYKTLEERENWLQVFAAGAFGDGNRRLFVWRRTEPLEIPPAVIHDPATLAVWKGQAPEVAPPPTMSFAGRVQRRLRRELLHRRVRAARRQPA